MTRKAQRRKLIKPLKEATGLDFVTRASLAKALVRESYLSISEVTTIIEKSGHTVFEDHKRLDCMCCSLTTLTYSVGEKYYSFSTKYGSFSRQDFGV